MSKRESVEEFLARGGKITKVATQPVPEDDGHKVTPSSPGGGLMTLADGSLFYSEIKEKKEKKKKDVPMINFAALPPHLLKYVKNIPKDE